MKFGPLRVVEAAYAIWSVLYASQTIYELNHPSPDIVLLSSFLPPELNAEISQSHFGLSLAVLILIVGSGWVLVRLMGSGRNWVTSTFIWSCVFSIAVCLWSLIFPDLENPFLISRGLPLINLLLLFVMLRGAYQIKNAGRLDDVSERK